MTRLIYILVKILPFLFKPERSTFFIFAKNCAIFSRIFSSLLYIFANDFSEMDFHDNFSEHKKLFISTLIKTRP